jgi:pimeloyl-ACP methyl ester carboxylesterase
VGVKVYSEFPPTARIYERHDGISQKVALEMHRRIAGSEIVIFQKSSHMPFWEQREEFMEVVGKLLERVG